jgi:mono/diheme cytochrome c family protein
VRRFAKLLGEVASVKQRWSLILLAPVVAGLVVLPGCHEDAYPEDLRYSFTPYPRVEGEGVKAKKVMFGDDFSDATKQRIARELEPFFGTPRNPLVKGIETEVETALQIGKDKLAAGSKVYRQYCVHCHGINGDAGGPTAEFITPRPRDFREGIYKFRSTSYKFRPVATRDDLRRTVLQGLPGSSMPSFNALSSDEVENVVSYVIHLSLRGLAEQGVAQRLLDKQRPETADLVRENANDWLSEVQTDITQPPEKWAATLGKWSDVYKLGTGSDPVYGNWAYGKKLFLNAEGKGGCITCHGVDGRANTVNVPDNLTRLNDWGDPTAPRNLTHGIFRGGSRPEDVYRRIRVGIGAGAMPNISAMGSFKGPDDLKGAMSEEDIWHLVGYVLSLSSKR